MKSLVPPHSDSTSRISNAYELKYGDYRLKALLEGGKDVSKLLQDVTGRERHWNYKGVYRSTMLSGQNNLDRNVIDAP
jgi:hypothetical protein